MGTHISQIPFVLSKQLAILSDQIKLLIPVLEAIFKDKYFF